MRTNPVEHRYGKPKPKPITFGIYKRTKLTRYGYCDYGIYKGKHIEIYHDTSDKIKLHYVSDLLHNWIKSKLTYFENGIKKITRSERK